MSHSGDSWPRGLPPPLGSPGRKGRACLNPSTPGTGGLLKNHSCAFPHPTPSHTRQDLSLSHRCQRALPCRSSLAVPFNHQDGGQPQLSVQAGPTTPTQASAQPHPRTGHFHAQWYFHASGPRHPFCLSPSDELLCILQDPARMLQPPGSWGFQRCFLCSHSTFIKILMSPFLSLFNSI